MQVRITSLLCAFLVELSEGYPFYQFGQPPFQSYQPYQQYPQSGWNVVNQPSNQIYQPQAYPAEYFVPAYPQQYVESAVPLNYQGRGIDQYQQNPYSLDSPYQYGPSIEVLPSYSSQYENYSPQLSNMQQYPQYYPPVQAQYPQYPMPQNIIPEVGNSYISAPGWPRPIKYYIDDRGNINPPLNPMGNIAENGKSKPYVNTDKGNSWLPVPVDKEKDDQTLKEDTLNPNVGMPEEEGSGDMCDQTSCYLKCRISLQGGGFCSQSDCTCYPKDGTKRPADNTWFELTEDEQQKILEIERKFEAVPAVAETVKSVDTTVATNPWYDETAGATVEGFADTTDGNLLWFDDPTGQVIDVFEEESGQDDMILIIDDSREVTTEDYDDSKSWDDGSGDSGDDEDEGGSWYR